MIKINFNQELFDKHIESISKKLKSHIETIDKTSLLEETNECLEHLKNEKELKNLLRATSEQLKYYIDFFEKEFPNSIGVDNQKEEDWTELYRVLRKEIFEKEYSNWSSRSKEYGAYEFVKSLDLKTCPYCNRNYTFIVNDESGKLRPEIDHFYPKSKYPFLAMSFFNLIPSCQICNHTKSNKVKKNLINPYDIKDGDFTFTYTPKSVDFIEVENQKYNFDSFEIELKYNQNNQDNIALFKLKELYAQHKDIVLELLIKKAYYPQSYIDELSKFEFSQDEIYRYLFSNYKKEQDLHKRPLSKLIKDITQELGI
jgi:5-methylcytosine-specific restriction endonuclease McrA